MNSNPRSLRPRQLIGAVVSSVGWIVLVGFGVIGFLMKLNNGRIDVLTMSVFGLLGIALIKLGRRLRGSAATLEAPSPTRQEQEQPSADRSKDEPSIHKTARLARFVGLGVVIIALAGAATYALGKGSNESPRQGQAKTAPRVATPSPDDSAEALSSCRRVSADLRRAAETWLSIWNRWLENARKTQDNQARADVATVAGGRFSALQARLMAIRNIPESFLPASRMLRAAAQKGKQTAQGSAVLLTEGYGSEGRLSALFEEARQLWIAGDRELDHAYCKPEDF